MVTTPGPSRRNARSIETPGSASSLTSNSKRKRAQAAKFYAVKAGRRPGVYYSWADCDMQTRQFPGAVYKSFTSLSDAQAFLSGAPTPSEKHGKPKFYGVQRGNIPGVYTDWESAQAQIKGATKPKYKAFGSRAEAEAFVNEGQLDVSSSASLSFGGGAISDSSGVELLQGIVSAASESSMAGGRKGCKTADVKAPASKKQKKNDGSPVAADPAEPGSTPLPADAEDGFDRSIYFDSDLGKLQWKTEQQLNARTLQAAGEAPGQVLRIWTDGSSLGNGQHGAAAGVGVFFGPNDERNISEPLSGDRATNQRAELTAILRALEVAPLNRNVLICTDSKYSIECCTEWARRWLANGWLTASKKPVGNRDIIEPIVNKIAERKSCNVTTEFLWLKGHSGVFENEQADRLAVAGARMAKYGE